GAGKSIETGCEGSPPAFSEVSASPYCSIFDGGLVHKPGAVPLFGKTSLQVDQRLANLGANQVLHDPIAQEAQAERELVLTGKRDSGSTLDGLQRPGGHRPDVAGRTRNKEPRRLTRANRKL